LAQAGENPDFAGAAKLIAGALKNIVKGASVVLKANNSGGGGGGQGLSCRLNDVPHQALGAAGTYLNATQQLTITGPTATTAVNLSVFGVTGPGTYSLGSGTMVQDLAGGINYAGNLSGTIHITTFNLAQQKASGTFTFSVSQTTPVANPSNVVNVTQGTFNITTLVNLPF
jgi:hypothetical protein